MRLLNGSSGGAIAGGEQWRNGKAFAEWRGNAKAGRSKPSWVTPRRKVEGVAVRSRTGTGRSVFVKVAEIHESGSARRPAARCQPGV